MIKNFSSADVYMLSGVWLIAINHDYAGYFCIAFAIVDAIAYSRKG